MALVIGIFIGLFTLAGIVVLVRIERKRAKNAVEEKEPTSVASDCCGAHEVCEFDKVKVNESIVEYYEDEELDEFQNVNEGDYTTDQIDQFRDVLYTLQTDEIKFWLLSIERRNIQLPSILKSEARMLMAEV